MLYYHVVDDNGVWHFS